MDTHWNTGNMIYGDNPREISLNIYVPNILAIMQSINLYVYCINNPLLFFDLSGFSIREPREFFESTFGAGATTQFSYKEQEEQPIWLMSSFSPITYTKGIKNTYTTAKYGDSNRPISVYAAVDANYVSTNTGIKFNFSHKDTDYSIKIYIGIDNTGVAFTYSEGDVTHGVALKLDYTKFSFGVETSQTASLSEIESQTTYQNASFSGWFLAAVWLLASTGQLQMHPPTFGLG